jgi:hypothetical protein
MTAPRLSSTPEPSPLTNSGRNRSTSLQKDAKPALVTPNDTPPQMRAPVNKPRRDGFEESLMGPESPVWYGDERISANLAAQTHSSPKKQSAFPPPPERQVLLLSRVTLCDKLNNPLFISTENESPLELPLALVFPPGNGRGLFLYANNLRLRINIDDFHTFRWWFDDSNSSIMVLKVCSTKILANVINGIRAGVPGQVEDWMFWEKVDCEELNGEVKSWENHYITIRAHSKDGARAVGEFGRVLDQTRFGQNERERTPGYEGYRHSVKVEAYGRNRDRSQMEPFPKRSQPPRLDDGLQDSFETRPKPTSRDWMRPRSPSRDSRPRADTWRPNRFSNGRVPRRSKSPDQIVSTEPQAAHDRERGYLQRDKLPEKRTPSDPAMERRRQKTVIDTTDQEKEKWIERALAKGKRR